MAGFQKYRIPRRLAGTSWMINKNWKMNTIGVAWTAVCLGFLTFRQLRVSIVNNILYRTHLLLWDNMLIPPAIQLQDSLIWKHNDMLNQTHHININ